MSADELPHETRSKGILWGFGVLVGIAVFVIIILGWYWGGEPEPFNIHDEAVKRHQKTGNETMPVGYVYTSTLAHIAEELLYKPGGYLTNDVSPPGLFLDNVPSWEFGALVMLRDGATALRNHFARDQSQSAEDPDLAKAEPYFYYERNSWALPSTEAEYEKGIAALNSYMNRLENQSATRPSRFYARADNLWQYFEVVIKRLGGLSTQLTASSSNTKLFIAMDVDEKIKAKSEALASDMERVIEKTEDLKQTPWIDIDNVFYEGRGACWALLHILKAVKHDFQDIIVDKRANNTIDIMVQALENALTPVMSPMILNGNGYGIFANYSLAMANYMARANAAALDLRDLMNKS